MQYQHCISLLRSLNIDIQLVWLLIIVAWDTQQVWSSCDCSAFAKYVYDMLTSRPWLFTCGSSHYVILDDEHTIITKLEDITT